jgi:6-phosphogluconolactonase
MLHFHEFSDFTQLSQHVAQHWIEIIQQSDANKTCSFALAGGTTPAPLYQAFDQLFAQQSKRHIHLVGTDERWVVDEDAASNEGLIKANFHHSHKYWNLISLKVKQQAELGELSTSLNEVQQRLKTHLPHPFTSVILGMGEDQHVASLFPNQQPSLDAQLACLEAVHPNTGQQRVSLSLMRLLNTERLWIVIKGSEKRKIIEQVTAQLKIKPEHYTSPISYILGLAKCDVDVYWCP